MLLPMAAEVRSSEQYHITGVDNAGGEWLIAFEGESNSYCMDKGLNGKPTSSVYWTFYGTTDLLEKAAQAGCTTKNEIQQYVWDHRQEASNSGIRLAKFTQNQTRKREFLISDEIRGSRFFCCHFGTEKIVTS